MIINFGRRKLIASGKPKERDFLHPVVGRELTHIDDRAGCWRWTWHSSWILNKSYYRIMESYIDDY